MMRVVAPPFEDGNASFPPSDELVQEKDRIEASDHDDTIVLVGDLFGSGVEYHVHGLFSH